MAGAWYWTVSTIVLALVLAAIASDGAGRDFTLALRASNQEYAKADGARLCQSKMLPADVTFIDTVSLKPSSQLTRVRVFLRIDSDASQSTSAASSCQYVQRPGDYLIFAWRKGSPNSLPLRQVGSGKAGFPIADGHRNLFVEITLRKTGSRPNLDFLALGSITVHLPRLQPSFTSGFATLSGAISAKEASTADHMITACQYRLGAVLRPVVVNWDVSQDVTRVDVYVMDRHSKNRQKLASASHTKSEHYIPTLVQRSASRIMANNYLAMKCFFKAGSSGVSCSANLLFETSSLTPASVLCNHTFVNSMEAKGPEPRTVVTEATDNPLLSLSDADAKSSKKARFEEVDWLQASGGRIASDGVKIGAVAGVAVDATLDRVAVVHTGDKTRHKSLFDDNNVYRYSEEGPIPEAVVLELDPTTGAVVRSWGKNFFYLPHGLFVDHLGKFWITDRAKHQVFGFHRGHTKPFLTLGEEFVPGFGDDQFCKPADVVVSSNSGTIFVADGHCNSRVMKFSASGHLLADWKLGDDRSAVYHSLALSPDDDFVCVAVSTSSQVHCVDPFSGTLAKTFQSASLPVPLEGIAFGGVTGAAGHHLLHAVGGGARSTPVSGVSMDFTSMEPVEEWGLSNSEGVTLAHGVSASQDGLDLYVADLAPGKVIKFSRRRPQATGQESTQVSSTLPSTVSLETEESTPRLQTTDRKSIVTTGARTVAPKLTTKLKQPMRATSSRRKPTVRTGAQSLATHKQTDKPVPETKQITNPKLEARPTTRTVQVPGSSSESTDSEGSESSPVHSSSANESQRLTTVGAQATAPSAPGKPRPPARKPILGTDNVNLEIDHVTHSPNKSSSHYRPLTGAETIAISIIGSCIGVVVFAVLARLYLSCQKRRKFRQRLFPEEYGDRGSRRILLQNGSNGYGDDDEQAEDSEVEQETYGDQRAFRYYWKKVAKQVT